MLNIIAPLDYERWAVLVNPLLVPGDAPVEAKAPPRQAEQLSPVNASLSGTSSRAGEGLREAVFRPMGLRGETIERVPEGPLIGPHPADLNWFFQLPGGVRESMQDRPTFDSREVTGLYDHPQPTRGTTVSIAG